MIAGRARLVFQSLADTRADRIEPLADQAREIGLPGADGLSERLHPSCELGAVAGELRHPFVTFTLSAQRLLGRLRARAARPDQRDRRDPEQQQKHHDGAEKRLRERRRQATGREEDAIHARSLG